MFSWSQYVQVWNAFFFSPEPVATLCVVRILLGLLIMMDGWIHWQFRKVFIAPDGVLSVAAFNKIYGRSRFTLFNLLPETQGSVDAVMALYFLSGFLMALGVGAPYCFAAAWILAVSLHHRSICFMSGGDSLLRIVLFLMCFSYAGAGLSVDAWLAGRGVFESLWISAPPWCTRLMQIQLALLYFRAVAFKMQGPAWRNGTAVLYAISNKNYQMWTIPQWLQSRGGIAIATYFTLIVEWSFAVLIWIRELRPALIVIGLLLHLGMEITLNLQLFSWLMMICLLLFVDPQFTLWIAEQLAGNPQHQQAVVLEGNVSYIVVNTFIALYVFYAYIWNAPDNTVLKPLVALIRPAVKYWGLWHSWSMFAPTLFSVTRSVELEVHFEDGEVVVWKPDFHSGMSRLQRFRHERFRKMGENCREGEFEYVRWCLCEYVIRQMRREHGNDRKITKVTLHHVDEPIADFNTTLESDLSIRRTLHYTYTVT